MLSLGRLHISDCLETFSNRRKLKSATAFQNIATSGGSNLTRMAVHEAPDPSGSTRATNGVDGTGAGGGACTHDTSADSPAGGDGGNGVVIIRYAI